MLKLVTVNKSNFLEFVTISKNSLPGKINCISIDERLNNYQCQFIWRQLKADGYYHQAGKEYSLLTTAGYKAIPTEM